MIPLLLSLALLGASGPAWTQARLSIAVAPVERSGYVPAGVGAAVQAALERELAASDRFALVERTRLEDVLMEASYQQAGTTDPQTAAELGRQLNVELLVFASVARLGSDYGLSLKVVDVESARVVRAEEAVLGRLDTTVRAAARRVAQSLVAAALALRPVAMVSLPAGTFTMGSRAGLPDEAPPHPVRIDAFALDRTEVSQAAFDAYLQGRGESPRHAADLDGPAAMVTWLEANQYCRSRGKRLPSEAEWEYAARGAEDRTFPWGEAAPTAAMARFGGQGPVAVDLPLAGVTPEGALHLAGNVAEWVEDWWDPAYYSVSPEHNPAGSADGDYRVVRGGGWSEPADALRSAARGYHNHLKGAGHIGFRCARSGAAP